MATILHIAGHGKKKNGDFDPGASGYIKQGEHRYYAESFFDLLKKHQPKGADVVYHTKYNVYDHGDIISLAKKYGKDTKVIEWHFDAFKDESANRGHVIVYSGFNPDSLDLRLRDCIKDMIGVRYSHKGQEGISGRSNLANVNRCANGRINYRLIELGFGTSPIDSKVMLKDVDNLAKKMTEAIFNIEIKTEVEKEQPRDSMAGYHIVRSGDTLWAIGQEYNVTVKQLKQWNRLDSDLIFPGQSLEIQGSDHPAPKPEPKPVKTPPKATVKNQIKVGSWVRVPANKLYATGSSNTPVKSHEQSGQIETINNKWKNPIRLIKNGTYLGFVRPKDILSETQTAIKKKTIDQMANEIIAGKHGNGHENRRKSLGISKVEYEKVRQRVNQLV